MKFIAIIAGFGFGDIMKEALSRIIFVWNQLFLFIVFFKIFLYRQKGFEVGLDFKEA